MNKIGPKLLDSLNDADFGEMFMSAFLTMDKAEASKVKQEQLKGSGWVSMYPSYVDKEMSVKDGRRVRSDCACENPTLMDVLNACAKLGLDCLAEPKRYPRRWWVPGRCRIRIHNADGSPCVTTINSRKELFHAVGKTIPLVRSEMQKAAPKPAATAATTKAAKKGKGKKK